VPEIEYEQCDHAGPNVIQAMTDTDWISIDTLPHSLAVGLDHEVCIPVLDLKKE